MSKKPRWVTITPKEIEEIERKKSLRKKEKVCEKMVRRPRWATMTPGELKKRERIW